MRFKKANLHWALLTLLTAIAASGQAWSADDGTPLGERFAQSNWFISFGDGSQSCTEVIRAGARFQSEFGGSRQIHPAHLQWVQGFLSGANWSHEQNLGRNLEQVQAGRFLVEYCRQQPERKLLQAALSLYQALYLQRQANTTGKDLASPPDKR